MKKLCILLLPLLYLAFTKTGYSQVSINPTAVFLDPNSKVGNFFIANSSENPVEIQLNFEFAYPDTDEEGNPYLNYEDQETKEQYSLEPYLRAFPSTFVLQPNQRQTVRLLARFPADKPDGTYWTRMRVSSSQLSPPIGEAPEGEVTAQVGFQIDQVTAVLVHHGTVQTKLTVHGSRVHVVNDRLVVLTEVERTDGNAPFIGSVRTRIFNPNGELITENSRPTSVYFKNLRRVEINMNEEDDEWPSGQYTAETTFVPSRNDVLPQHIPQIDPVSTTTTFTID
ncbi:MAG: hypothetical protein WD035_01660 [Balneolaceae bacterium]